MSRRGRVVNIDVYQGSQRGANAPPSRAPASVAGVSSAGHGSVAETSRSNRTNRTRGTQALDAAAAAAPAPGRARAAEEYAAMSDEEILTHSETIFNDWYRVRMKEASMQLQMGTLPPEAVPLQLQVLQEFRAPCFANSPLVLREMVKTAERVRGQIRAFEGQGQGMGLGQMLMGQMMF